MDNIILGNFLGIHCIVLFISYTFPKCYALSLIIGCPVSLMTVKFGFVYWTLDLALELDTMMTWCLRREWEIPGYLLQWNRYPKNKQLFFTFSFIFPRLHFLQRQDKWKEGDTESDPFFTSLLGVNRRSVLVNISSYSD